MELSIDTSTRYASVGLSLGGETLAERTWRSERNHSVELVPTIRELMARVGVEMADLNAVFSAKGPGGFSALRVGMSTAKALATALSIPLFAVNSLDIEAHQYLGLNAPVCAIITAGRNRLYVGTYDGRAQPDGSTYEVISARGAVFAAEAWRAALRRGGVLAGRLRPRSPWRRRATHRYASAHEKGRDARAPGLQTDATRRQRRHLGGAAAVPSQCAGGHGPSDMGEEIKSRS